MMDTTVSKIFLFIIMGMSIYDVTEINAPNARAKRRGGKALPRSQNVTPRPLERWVGRPGQETKLGLHGFCSFYSMFKFLNWLKRNIWHEN